MSAYKLKNNGVITSFESDFNDVLDYYAGYKTGELYQSEILLCKTFWSNLPLNSPLKIAKIMNISPFVSVDIAVNQTIVEGAISNESCIITLDPGQFAKIEQTDISSIQRKAHGATANIKVVGVTL